MGGRYKPTDLEVRLFIFLRDNYPQTPPNAGPNSLAIYMEAETHELAGALARFLEGKPPYRKIGEAA